MGSEIVLGGPGWFDDPHRILDAARAESVVVPARATMMLRGTGVVVTRHAEVASVYADRRFSSDRLGQPGARRIRWMLPPIVRLLGETMVMRDDPEHLRLRRLVVSAFTPRFVAGLEPMVTQVAEQLADDLVRRGGGDLVRDYAVELPLRVIASMLGLGDDHRETLRAAVLRMHELPSGSRALLTRVALMRRIIRALDDVVAAKRARPDDGLVSAVIAASSDGEQLTEREVLATVFLFFLAGHDTTSNLLSGGMLALVDHPDQRVMLREDAAIWPSAVDELLRFVTPVTTGSIRFPTEDVVVGGHPIAAGTQVLPLILAANHDPAVFDDPHRLDLRRDPNPHLSFATGTHFCLGHHLARLEGRIGLEVLTRRCPDLRLSVPRRSLTYRPDITARSLQSMPVVV